MARILDRSQGVTGGARSLLAALLILLGGPGRSAGIRFLEEFKFEDATSSYVQVSANRYFLVGYPMEKNGDVLRFLIERRAE
jgi:hypothetical protein